VNHLFSPQPGLGQLAGEVAHHINSPLAALSVALDSAEATLHDPEVARKFLRLAAQAGRRAAAIVQELSDSAESQGWCRV
jgi:signal transduction histidine kinase